MEEGAFLAIHDPKVDPEQISSDLGSKSINKIEGIKNIDFEIKEGDWYFSRNIENVTSRADAVVVLTEWQQYANLDWKFISKGMRSPAWIFDARSILDPDKVKECELNFWRIGDGFNAKK